MKQVDINNPASYKNCSKKQYEIWVCKPPIGTIVFNKLEQAQAIARLKQFGVKGLEGDRQGYTWFAPPEQKDESDAKIWYAVAKETYNELVSFVQSTGQGYIVSQQQPFVLSGTEGEMSTIDANSLAFTYFFLENGQPVSINNNILNRRCDVNGNMPWYKVRVKTGGVSNTMACFLPLPQRAQIKTSRGAVLFANDPSSYIKHGKGDFIVCDKLPDGKPNLAKRRVVNGLIFGATYNNQGWTDCLASTSQGVKDVPKPMELFKVVNKSDNVVEYNKDVYNFIGNLLAQCAKNQHQELKFAVQKSKDKENEIIVKASVINDYAIKHSKGEHLEDSRKAVITDKCSHVETSILVGKDNVTFTQYDYLSSGNKEYSYKFSIPATKEGCMYLEQNKDTIIGLLGYVRGDVGGLFDMSALTKQEYDALASYTDSSGTINALCRAIESTSGKWAVIGEDRAFGYRSIRGCDSAFNKMHLQRPVTVFRGAPCNAFFKDKTGRNFETLSGTLDVNDGFTSTTLNAQSAPMFAGNGSNEGIIIAMTLPVGTRCSYIHNIAGWVQQYEILLDRCYDIHYGETILEFHDSAQKHYKIVKGELVQHQPFGRMTNQSGAWWGCKPDGVTPINSSKHAGENSIHNYNEFGKTPVEIGDSLGALHDAFEILRNRGFTDVQWQKATLGYSRDMSGNAIDSCIQEAIVLHLKDEGDGDIHKDLAFSLENLPPNFNNRNFALKITPIVSTDDSNARYKYGGAKDKNWSTYNVGADIQEVHYKDGIKITDKEAIKAGAYDETRLEFLSADELKDSVIDSKMFLDMEVKYLSLDDDNPDTIAKRIFRYAQANKNICLYPLVDVARYFDLTFRAVINSEGYELLRSIRVERIGKDNDNQDGYVPLKYQINGDNDDHLTIRIKFYRDKNNKLNISFAGRNNNNSVNEEKKLTYAIFNNTAMYNLSLAIIYTFAKKLHLSKARKFDNLISYFCRNTGFASVHVKQEGDATKTYKIWTSDRQNWFELSVYKEDAEIYSAVIKDKNETYYPSFKLNTSLPIYVLYGQLCDCIFGNDSKG